MAAIKRKWVEVVEIVGTGKIELERGKRVVDTKIIHQTMPSAVLTKQYPPYKTIFVLECVEFEEEID